MGKEIIEKFYISIRSDKNLLNLPEKNLSVYRDLLINSVYQVCSSAFPLTKKFVGEEWDHLISDFFNNFKFSSPYLWHVPKQFLEYLDKKDFFKKRDYLKDLMLYEWIEIEIFNKDLPVNESQFDLDRKYILSSSAEIVVFSYPVHEISYIGFTGFKEKKGKYYLIIYQSPYNYEVEYIKITPFLYDLVKGLQEYPLHKTLEHISDAYSIDINQISYQVEKFVKLLLKNRILI